MNFKQIGCEGVNCIHLVQDRVQWQSLPNTVMNVRFQVLTAASMKMTVFLNVAPLYQTTWHNIPEDSPLRGNEPFDSIKTGIS
jgi:hypothetical protein